MLHFCATLAPTEPAREITQMGGHLAYAGQHYALGRLTDKHPIGSVEPWSVSVGGTTLIGVGAVTLYNRATLVAMLSRELPATAASCADGELLLWLYARYGPAGLAQVSGMFALAIWDGTHLLLLRDPVGTRTLFYTRVAGIWAAASSLRALRRWPRLPARLNFAAVRSFLTFAYLPGDETLLAGVQELLPGCCLRLALNGTATLERYWEPCEGTWNPDDPPEVYATHLRTLLEDVTRNYLPRDQEVGALLSGGLDSSLVTALAARLHDRPVTTYSISFGDELPNELAYAGLVATHCRTRHRVLSVTGVTVAAYLAEAVAYLDCPVGDPLTVPNMLLARAAADEGIRVLLNGEGGDPCFGGPKNIPMLLFELQRDDDSPDARSRIYLRAYRKCYDDLPQLLSPAALEALRDAPPLERLVAPYLQSDGMRHYLNRLMHANVRMKGAHHILTKVERLTAACGVEGRSPLFDPAVVAYSFAIPPQFKLAATTEKWVLKQAVRDLLPTTILDRPKSGMRVPVQHWLHGPLRTLAGDLLLGPQARARDLFRPETIRAWLRGEGSLWPRQGGKLWLVLTLELWLRAYLDRAELTPDYFARRRWWRVAWERATERRGMEGR